MKIGVDLDEVVVDLVKPLLSFYESTTGRKFLFNEVFTYNLEEVWGCTKEEAVEAVRAFYRTKEFDSLSAIEGALSSLELLSAQHEIVFITARHNEAIEKTKLWIDRNCAFPNQVIYSGEYQHRENERVTKADICLREGAQVMIEDNSQYAVECADRGIRTYLFTKPWNITTKHPRIKRVSSWKQINESFASQNSPQLK